MKRSLPIVPLFLTALILSCDFQNPADFEVPKWIINLTIPLLDADYALAEIANDSTIHSDSLDNSLSIKFDGELPRDSVTADFLKVPLNIDMTIAESIAAPTLEGSFETISLVVPISIPMGVLVLNPGNYDNLADPGNNIVIPSTSEQRILGSDWNEAASKI